MKKLTKSNNDLIKTAIIAILIVLFILLGIPQKTSTSYQFTEDLSEENAKAVNMVDGANKIWSPQITLPKGSYTMSFNSNANIVIVSADGTVLAKGNGTLTLDLDKDITEMYICTNASGQLSDMELRAKGTIFNDLYFLALIAVILLLYFSWLKSKSKRELLTNHDYTFLMIVVMAIFVTYPHFTPNLYFGDDLCFHLYRVEGIKDGLLSGQFPVRIHPTANNGYGAYTASMYGELFLYIPAFLRIMGVSYVYAWKIFLFIINIATGMIMYYSAKGIAKSRYAGIIAAMTYMLCAQRLFNVYSRSAIGEGLAMAFFPLIIYGMYEILIGDKNKWWVLALGCTGVFQSHMISCLFAGLFIIASVIVFVKNLKDRRYIYLILAFAVTLLINMWFIVPFAYNYLFSDFNIRHSSHQYTFLRNTIPPVRLFNALFEQAVIDGSKDRTLSIGIGTGILAVIGLFYFVRPKKLSDEDKGCYKFNILMLFSGLIFMIACTTVIPWETLAKLKFIYNYESRLQFAWRMLSPAVVLLCMSGAYAFEKSIPWASRKILGSAFIIFCSVLFIIFGTAFTKTMRPIAENPTVSIQRHMINGSDYEYLPGGTDAAKFIANTYKTSDSRISVSSHEKSGTNLKFTLTGSGENAWVEVPMLYDKGYMVTDNKHNRLKTEAGTNHVLRIYTKNDTEEIKIRYAGTVLYKIGDIISLLTLIALLAAAYARKKKIPITEVAKNITQTAKNISHKQKKGEGK